MDHYKLQSTKSKLFYRLIPTFMFIIAITTIVLTVFFMLVLQSRNAYELDGDDDPFRISNDDFQMEIDGVTSDQIANLDIDDISFEDNTNLLTTTPQPQYETFLLKKTINPTTNNHIQPNNNLQSMKAYKIVSKKPIIENSLVKIVMAPHNVLEKLSRQDQRNGKYAIDTIDKSGNAPIKEHSIDEMYGRELIRNGNGNVNVEVFSMEDERNIDFMETVPPTQPVQNVLHHGFNNIQVISKTHKQPLKMISNERKIPLSLIREIKVGNRTDPNRNQSEGVSEFKSLELETNSTEVIPEIESIYKSLPATTEAIIGIDSAFTDAEELPSNPTTSQNVIPTPTPEDIKFESVEDTIATEINASDDRTSLKDFENLPMKSLEISTENSAPVVALKILKNRTVLLEERGPQSTPVQLGVETVSVPKTVAPVVRPKKITRPTTTTTTTKAPKVTEVKKQQFPKKATFVNSYNKHKKVTPKIDDVSFEVTTKTGLLDVEMTEVPSLSETLAKSKNTKRAVGDEGSFSSNIVRPSPIRPKKIVDLFPHETDAERAERLSKSMQRLMHFVTIVGHVDSYLTKRVRNGLKNAARIFDSIEDTRRRRHNL